MLQLSKLVFGQVSYNLGLNSEESCNVSHTMISWYEL